MLRWWWGLWIVPFWGLSIVDWTAEGYLDGANAEIVDVATRLVG